MAQAATAPELTSWRSILSGPRGRLTLGLALITLSVATESLIVTSIMPVIVRDLGGLNLYGLAFSAFFLAGLASIPTAGWMADRFGPSLPFVVLMGIFLAGTVAASLAPSMPVLVLARVAQGYGAGAQFTISQSTVARAFAEGARVKVLSLLSATWVLPSLVGPALGSVIATAFGWRWAFAVIIAPALAAFLLTYPSLRRIGRTASQQSTPLPLARPLLVAAGAGLVVIGLTAAAWWGALLFLVGLPVLATSLRHVVPPGTFGARRGLPAIVAASFVLNMAFYAAASFVPLVLTGVRHTSITQAGIAVTVATFSWTVGVWINTQLIGRLPRELILTGAASLLLAGIAGFALALAGVPLLFAFAAWALAGAGMGIVFNTLTLNAMAAAPRGGEGQAMGGRNLSSSLGTAMGTGLGGVAIAAGHALGLPLSSELAAIYAFALLSALATMALAHRATPAG